MKRGKKHKMTAEEIEAQRVAAHEETPVVDPVIAEQEAEKAKVLVEQDIQREDDLAERIDKEWAGEEEAKQAFVQAVAADLEKEALEEEFPDEDEPKEPNSVVKAKFKDRYIENARNLEIGRKAAKRSNWDWLAQKIAEDCLGEKDKINIDAFMDVLDANGVDHSKWTNRNKGWEGRFRMTGRVALQRIVADRGEYKGLNSISVPPPEWIAKYKTKS